MNTRPCTTPHKRSYATRDDAEMQRTLDGLHYGTALYPYQCICGQWHLSRDAVQHLPAYETPKPEDVARIRALNIQDFTQLVDADVKGTAATPSRLALRHPDNLTRWRHALKALRTRVHRQIAAGDRRHDKTAWHEKAIRYRNQIDLHLAECQRLRAQASRKDTTAA